MTVQERIEKALAKKSEHPDFKKLAEFYEHMRQAGLVLKKSYELPPLDTVGREFYKELVSKSSQVPS